MMPSQPGRCNRIVEVTLLFLRLGLTAFGGPAAHIAMFRDEGVKRRKWIDDQPFLDMLGATNLIPDLSSTGMEIHLGFVRDAASVKNIITKEIRRFNHGAKWHTFR